MPAHATFVGGPLAGTRTTHTVRCLDADGAPVRRVDMHTNDFASCYHRFRAGPTDDAPIHYLWGAALDTRFSRPHDEPQ